MKYANREMKVDQIISYFNEHKINLIPPFQRGTVWSLPTRQKLMVNMVTARPIPAVFLYKQALGAKFAYNILDGKQRLETLILFVGDKRDDLKVEKVKDYFFGKPAANDANFSVKLDGKKALAFKDLDEELVRAFREYAIPTIEIDLDDYTTSIDEIINLFIDINQQGVKVTRFEVVKALGKDPLFQQMFNLISLRQKRKRSVYYKAKAGNFVFVLKRLNIVSRLVDRNSQVDRMWERLTEIGLFVRSKKHRAPAEILKAFIKAGTDTNAILTKAELKELRKTFDFLATAYRKSATLMESKLATDQPQFYTLVTTLLSTDLLDKYDEAELIDRLAKASKIMDGAATPPDGLEATILEYKELSAKQTTHPARRDKRQSALIKAIEAV